MICRKGSVGAILGCSLRKSVEKTLIVLVLLVFIIFWGSGISVLADGLLVLVVIAIYQVLEVLILLLEFFFNFNVDEL